MIMLLNCHITLTTPFPPLIVVAFRTAKSRFLQDLYLQQGPYPQQDLYPQRDLYLQQDLLDLGRHLRLVRPDILEVRDILDTLEAQQDLQHHQLPACHPPRQGPVLPAVPDHLDTLCVLCALYDLLDVPVLPVRPDLLDHLAGLQRHLLPARHLPQQDPAAHSGLDLLGVLVLPALPVRLCLLVPREVLLVLQVPGRHSRPEARELQTCLGVLDGLWGRGSSIYYNVSCASSSGGHGK
ncbi:unnamed protein product [Clonostachys rosea]|uniref:Uncharacterized protein n=1 Tax=Bionectria ochroleuca TaxID=29856 RepID=A0ABY6UHI4_BIOOC|nr:unnamed protein product [Clonostachys rosea]